MLPIARSPRARTLTIVAVAAALAAIVVGVVLLAGAGGGSPVSAPTPGSPSTTSTPAPVPTATAPASADDAADGATAAVTALVALSDTVLADPEESLDGLDDIAAGFVQGEIEALAAERADQGYTQTGSARILSVAPRDVALDTDPPTVTLDVCIDASDIDVLDAAGNSMAGTMYRPDHPVLHVYGAQLLDGTWKIVTHDIPDTPTPCS